MPKWMSLSLGIMLLGAGVSGCDQMDEDPSLLETPRILAVQLTPRNLTLGIEHTLEALTHEINALTWTGCLTPFIPDAEVSCPVPIPGTPLALMDPALSVSLTLPEGLPLTSFWVKLTAADASVLPVVFEIGEASGTENPGVTGLADADGNPITEVKVGTTVEVWPQLVDPLATNRLTVSFFTTIGSFQDHRTIDGAPSIFEAPAEAGTASWIVIVRDGEEGIGWIKQSIEVVE